jgi:hypothetical protein
MKEQAKLMGISTVWVLWFLVIMVAGGFIYGITYAVQQNIIRNQQTHSTGFVMAQVELMSKSLTAFQKNEVELAKYNTAENAAVVKAIKSQQMGIVIDVWTAYDLIPQDAKDSVPNTILTFLNTHPRNWQP